MTQPNVSSLYISLKELDKAMSKSVVTGISLRTIIREVPTINITGIIDEMIEEIRKVEANPTDPKFPFYTQRLTLQELKQRLTK